MEDNDIKALIIILRIMKNQHRIKSFTKTYTIYAIVQKRQDR